MNLSSTRPLFKNPLQTIANSRIRSGAVYGVVILMAMVAFEAFNYGTTAYALRDLLGDLKFAGVPWATLMAMAFCGLDFAGIARLITQNGRREGPKESWYLFGAWLIAATFNAALTWWGVAIAISGHSMQSASVVSTQTLTKVVPVLVAILVWIIRILIIGSLSATLERINASRRSPNPMQNQVRDFRRPVAQNPVGFTRPIPSNRPNHSVAAASRPEPTYHTLSETPISSVRNSEGQSSNQRSHTY